VTASREQEGGIGYEVITKPWFGPRSRGKAILLQSPLYGRAYDPKDFIAYLCNRYEQYLPHLQWLRFYSCTFRERTGEQWEQRFAVCSTRPHYPIRKVLHDDGNEIANQTGWYLLVSGERIKTSRAKLPPWMAAGTPLDRPILERTYGGFKNIRGLDPAGCALLVEFDQESVLLDLGFDFVLPKDIAAPTFGILTHTHRDHSGGLHTALAQNIPVLLSESVYWQLRVLGATDGSPELTLRPLRPPVTVEARDGTRFAFLPGAHSPGAMMMLITTSKGDQLLYPGDYCLSNGYYSQTPDDLLTHFSSGSGARWLLVDGTFLGHGPGQANNMNLADVNRLLASEHQTQSTTFFTAESPDYLYSAYIWLFQTRYTGEKTDLNRQLVVDERVLRLMETTFEPFILRQHARYDPFLRGTLRLGMSNYLESVRLYPVRAGSFPEALPEPYDIFCLPDLLPTLMQYGGRNPLVLAIGRPGKMLNALLSEPDTRTARVIPLDGPDFAFHSAESDVVSLILAAIDSGVRPLVFHNFPARVSKELRKRNIVPGKWTSLFSSPVPLSTQRDWRPPT